MLTIVLATLSYMVMGSTIAVNIIIICIALTLEGLLTLAYMSVPVVSSFFERLTKAYNESRKPG